MELDMKQSQEGGFVREGFGWLDTIMSPQKPNTRSTVDSCLRAPSTHMASLQVLRHQQQLFNGVGFVAVLGCEPQS